jgi:hypothetical protein
MTDLLGFPLAIAAVIIVYLGEKIQQVMLTRVLRDALSEAQAAAHGRIPQAALPAPEAPKLLPAPAPAPAPALAPPTPAPAPALTPAQAPTPTPAPPHVAQPPAPSGPFADAPAWFQWALHEIGFHEVGNNQGLSRYISLAHCGEAYSACIET